MEANHPSRGTNIVVVSGTLLQDQPHPAVEWWSPCKALVFSLLQTGSMSSPAVGHFSGTSLQVISQWLVPWVLRYITYSCHSLHIRIWKVIQMFKFRLKNSQLSRPIHPLWTLSFFVRFGFFVRFVHFRKLQTNCSFWLAWKILLQPFITFICSLNML